MPRFAWIRLLCGTAALGAAMIGSARDASSCRAAGSKSCEMQTLQQPIADTGADLTVHHAFPPDETFDESNPPALPTGWGNFTTSAATPGWYVAQDAPFNATFAAHATDPSGDDAQPMSTAQSDSQLFSPPFLVVHSGQLTFAHRFGLETHYDAAILEIKIGTSATSLGSGPYTEISAAGGEFVIGGYNGTLLPGATPNPIEFECHVADPLAQCLAWTGGSGPDGDGQSYSDVVVNLPAAADGKLVQLRWRLGSDGNGPPGYPGYWLDNVHVDVGEVVFGDGFDVRPD